MEFSEFFKRMGGLSVFPLFLAYIIAIAIVPRFWKKYTKPLELKLVLLVYNVTCSLLSVYTTVGLCVAMLKADRIYTNTNNPTITYYLEIYGYTKVLELMDTVFMVLRHHHRQITLLHVYHHSTMLLLVFYAVRYSPWAALAPGIALNSFVHICLYFYYGYTSFFSTLPTWKRRITELQIVQFVIDLVYCTIGVLYYSFCIWSVVYGGSMLILFSNFYLKAYILRPSLHTELRATQQNGENGDSRNVLESTGSKGGRYTQ